MKRFAWVVAVTAAIAASPTPASSASNIGPIAGSEQNRAAFAGATVRVELGGRSAAAPEARLGLGLLQDRRNPASGIVSRTVSRMPIAIGAADGRLQFFSGGEQLSKSQARLGLSGESTALLVAGGIAAGVLVVLLLAKKDDEDKRSPCPPGVEVCTQR